MSELLYSDDCVRKQFQAFLDGNLTHNETRELLEVLMDRSRRYEDMRQQFGYGGVVMGERRTGMCNAKASASASAKVNIDELRRGWVSAAGIHPERE